MVCQCSISKFVKTAGLSIIGNLLIPGIRMVLSKPVGKLLQLMWVEFRNSTFNLFNLRHGILVVEKVLLFNIPISSGLDCTWNRSKM